MAGHVVPRSTYYGIFAALMVLTALTVWAAFLDLGAINTPVALTIACVKALLVILFFMHVRYSTRLIWVILTSALFWMGIMFALTFSDYWTRDWISIGY